MRQLRPLRLLAAVVALVVGVSACSSEPPTVIVSGNDPATSAKDLAETLETQGFTVMAALVEEAGLTESLTAEGTEALTLFAPSDAAFADLGEGVQATLIGEDDVYVVPLADAAAAVGASEEAEEQAAENPNAEDEDDVAPTSGPEAAVPAETESEAPTETVELTPEESRELLTAILEYHMVDGVHLSEELASESSLTSVEGSTLTIGSREEEPTSEDGEPTTVLTVDEADITAPDLFATNGVIHTIDNVLVPEDQREALDKLIASIPVATDAMNTLRNSPDHTQLVAAIEAAGLEGDLETAEAITIFAPTDAAFDALTDDQRTALEDPDVLEQVLKHHVVGRSLNEDDVQNAESVSTLAGDRVTITKDGDTYTVGDATIERQIPATNGFVLVIDAILVPESAQGPGGL